MPDAPLATLASRIACPGEAPALLVVPGARLGAGEALSLYCEVDGALSPPLELTYLPEPGAVGLLAGLVLLALLGRRSAARPA